MALINCPECGKEISDKATECISCGYPIRDIETIDNIPSSIPKKPSFWEALKAQVVEMDEAKHHTSRRKELDKQGIAYCPKCTSTSLSAHKKGFGIGKAVVGSVIDPIGLVAGNIGAKKVRVTCLKCGHQFWAGKRR